MSDEKKTSGKQAPKRNELGQLEPGSTANPKGRPKKGTSYAERIRKAMDKKVSHYDEADVKKAELQAKDAIIEKQITLALDGDRYSVAWLANREEGMPKERIEHQGAIPVEFTGDNAADFINSKLDE